MLSKASSKSSVGLKSEGTFHPKDCVDLQCTGLKGFFGVAYPNTLLDFDSSFTNAKFAEEYCSNISTFS